MSEAWGRLRDEIAAFTAEPYLLTVNEGAEPHCGTVTVTWDADKLVVRPASDGGTAGTGGDRPVSLLWPPRQPGGYSLIVDGVARMESSGGDTWWVVEPTKAVLHRRGDPPSSSGSSCGSDCIPIIAR